MKNIVSLSSVMVVLMSAWTVHGKTSVQRFFADANCTNTEITGVLATNNMNAAQLESTGQLADKCLTGAGPSGVGSGQITLTDSIITGQNIRTLTDAGIQYVFAKYTQSDDCTGVPETVAGGYKDKISPLGVTVTGCQGGQVQVTMSSGGGVTNVPIGCMPSSEGSVLIQCLDGPKPPGPGKGPGGVDTGVGNGNANQPNTITVFSSGSSLTPELLLTSAMGAVAAFYLLI